MKTVRKKPVLAAIRSVVIALFSLIVINLAVTGLLYEDLGSYLKFKYEARWVSLGYDFFVFIIYNSLIVAACFHIVKSNPNSIWFVPIICNLYGIVAFISEPASFWMDSFGIILCSALVLSIIASIIGVRKGEKITVSTSPETN